jgi:hypothetical protein
MMFWLGLIIGGCVGTICGVLVNALCQSAGNADRRMKNKE